LSRKNSLSEAAKWITEIRSFTNKRIPIVLIGNRISLMETNHVTINKEEIRDIVNKENLMYIETSTNTGNQIDEMFTELTKHIIQQKVE
jgi:GTPase SAR1 family protein